MLLVDTNVWIEHLRTGVPLLEAALRSGQVLGHPWVLGELALGGVSASALGLIDNLRRATVAEPGELATFIRSASLAGRGVGYVDAQLLASARLTVGARLWTLDRRLADLAREHGVEAPA